MLQKTKKCLWSEKAEANYISAVIYVLVGVIIIVFVLGVFSLISIKIKLDQSADQVAKQIQLAGGINSDTEELLEFLKNDLPGASNLDFTINTEYHTPRPADMKNAVQLGTAFYITLKVDAELGGFWKVLPTKVTVASRAAGVSEVYWK